MATMQAVQVHDYNQPAQLRLEEIPVPALQDDEVLVRIAAASVNPIDWRVCDGTLREKLPTPLPFTPGGDFSGEIAAVGGRVTAFKMGDAVFGMTSTPGYCAGAFAQFAAVKARHAAQKPLSLSHVEAAAVPLAALTAWQAVFDRGSVSAGQRVLIHAGAGGVGSFAVQFARIAGATITATSSAANRDYLLGLGAADVIDYHAVQFEDVLKNLDVVIDLLGGEIQARSYKVLRPGGILVNALGAVMEDKAKAAGVRGVKVAVAPNAAQLNEIAKLIDTGQVRVTIAKVFPMAEVAAALALSRTGRVRGKIVLEGI